MVESDFQEYVPERILSPFFSEKKDFSRDMVFLYRIGWNSELRIASDLDGAWETGCFFETHRDFLETVKKDLLEFERRPETRIFIVAPAEPILFSSLRGLMLSLKNEYPDREIRLVGFSKNTDPQTLQSLLEEELAHSEKTVCSEWIDGERYTTDYRPSFIGRSC